MLPLKYLWYSASFWFFLSAFYRRRNASVYVYILKHQLSCIQYILRVSAPLSDKLVLNSYICLLPKSRSQIGPVEDIKKSVKPVIITNYNYKLLQSVEDKTSFRINFNHGSGSTPASRHVFVILYTYICGTDMGLQKKMEKNNKTIPHKPKKKEKKKVPEALCNEELFSLYYHCIVFWWCVPCLVTWMSHMRFIVAWIPMHTSYYYYDI